MKNIKVGFIGTGNMGTPMITSLAKSDLDLPSNVHIFDIDNAKTQALSKNLGITVSSNTLDLVKACDIIILAVKPNICSIVLEECKSGFDNSKILVSIAAGVSIGDLKKFVGDNVKCVRTMPNTPAQVNAGITVICPDSLCSSEETQTVVDIFNCFGETQILREDLMNNVIALTSSSPAYVFMFIEAMADAAVQSGIPRDLAYKMGAQAVYGSAKLVLETGEHPGKLKDNVCSPAGTTIEAVNKLEEKGFRSAVIEAMKACTDKANNMKK